MNPTQYSHDLLLVGISICLGWTAGVTFGAVFAGLFVASLPRDEERP